MTAGVRRRCTGCGRRVWVRFDTDGRGREVERVDPCACNTTPALDPGLFAAAFQRPASEEAFLDVPRNPMPKHRTTREQREAIRAYVRQLRTEMPELTPSEGLRAVADRFGIEFTPQTFNPTYWHKAEPEPAAEPAEPAEPNGNGFHPAVTNRLVTATEAGPVALQDLAFSEAVHGSPREAALAEEVKSLRATYESGPGLHLEELDGEWRLRADLFFSDLPTAAAVLAAIGGVLRGQEVPDA